MPRMLRRAAVLGATAHVASRRGAAQAQAAQEQAAAAAPPPVPAQTAAPVVEETAGPVDSYEELMKLKGLLDAGVLTQAEFDAEKQKILDS
jgi:hypothetical protein